MRAQSSHLALMELTWGGVPVVHTGISGVVVDARDFKVWEEYVHEKIFPAQKKLSGTALAMAIAMIWPDQSYTSLKIFRGTSKRKLCEFHTTRIRALSGKYASGLKWDISICF